MSCISGQINRLTSQVLDLRAHKSCGQGSMDLVRFARTRKIENGRSSELHIKIQSYSSGGSGQRTSDQGSWLVVHREWEKEPRKLGQVNSSEISEVFQARDQ